MNYLIIGTGGVGGSIAGFLALAGKEVTCIARGKHLENIRNYGLHLKSDLKGEHYLKVNACTAEEYQGKADVIFVCVKGYSIDSVKEVIERASAPHTLVIPILNVYGTGPRIGRLTPEVTVLDGCIYIVGFVSGEGEITQMGSIFRLVFEHVRSREFLRNVLKQLQRMSEVAVSKSMFPMISTATHLSNGHLFRQWHVLEHITMYQWEKYNTKAKYEIHLSDFPEKVQKSDTRWEFLIRKILFLTI